LQVRILPEECFDKLSIEDRFDKLSIEDRFDKLSIRGNLSRNGKWIVYIIQCSDKTLYTGTTSDIERRVKEHNTKKGSKYTRTRLPVRLVYTETYNKRSEALKREIQVKAWTRAKKIALIEKDRKKLQQLSICKARKQSIDKNPLAGA
jgi:putative endonuclease